MPCKGPNGTTHCPLPYLRPAQVFSAQLPNSQLEPLPHPVLSWVKGPGGEEEEGAFFGKQKKPGGHFRHAVRIQGIQEETVFREPKSCSLLGTLSPEV